jgi:dTDP-4-dehydrorhamnose 3,5-epimerase
MPFNLRRLYIPESLAHGFQTLEDNTEVFYQMSAFYYPECARGVTWNDPIFRINWPPDELIISSKDQSYPPFQQSVEL